MALAMVCAIVAARADGIDLRPSAGPGPAQGEPFSGWPLPSRRGEDVEAALAPVVHEAAALHDLPAPFVLRLLGRESAFDPNAVSRAGALGIAQFMPATAQAMGLADPFDPVQSVSASTRYLALLRRQFGNLGLAAAAYNAGPGRVQRWLAGQAALPAETVGYVRSITGRSVLDFAPPGLRVGLLADPGGAMAGGGWESRLLADLLKASGSERAAGTGPTPMPGPGLAGGRANRFRAPRGEAALCQGVSRPGAPCIAASAF